MSPSLPSRRRFVRTVGAALGACAVPIRIAAKTPAASAARPGAATPAKAVRIDSNENPYGPSPKALEAMTRSQQVSARYPDALEDEVSEALARLHGVGAENVVLGCGSGELLRMADMAFLGAGRNVVVAEPTFEAVLAFARVTRADAVKIALTGDHRHDLPKMAAACSEATGLIYLCNPNNPTGTIVTRDEMGAFFERVPRGAVILVDEAYHHFVEDERYASAFEWMGKLPNLLVVRTFSKIHGLAGMRLGYGVGAHEVVEALRAHRLWSNANAAVLEAALATLQDAGHASKCRREMNGTRRWLVSEMEKDRRATIPSEANFVMIDLGTDVAPVIAALKERGVFVGRRFAALPNHLRVSIGTPEEMRRFVAALRAVAPSGAIQAA
ncbi:MAG TPA: histidinol-phosphate transaminase [Candidatus Polarisedimenticolia bacterium]|jgi:histidinol-phosphate aminotransferase|nr:histidinol-phosphate transaminase [Candidatus Polarisedimenticolia bacterium]